MPTVQTPAKTRAITLLQAHLLQSHARTRDILAPAPAAPESAAQALSYLDAFGYLEKELDQWQDISLQDILKAVDQFRDMFGLGHSAAEPVDIKVIRAMQKPRCGCPDVIRPWHQGYRDLQSAAATLLAKWQKGELTYYIQNFIPGVDPAIQLAAVQRGFDAWTVLGSGIRVTQAAPGTTPDIVISVGRGRTDNFDGPFGTLAWSYMPSADGGDAQLTCKFDLDETWLFGNQATSRGILFLNTATHEFGHLFGLDHSKVAGALMAPTYDANVPVPQANDDIPRFQARYGAATGLPVPPPVVPPVLPPTDNRPTIAIRRGSGAVITVDGVPV